MAVPVPTKSSGQSRLSIPQLTTIHVSHPEIGRALQAILDYINLNVTPAPGNKVHTNYAKRVTRA
jgi:hypothetical protein